MASRLVLTLLALRFVHCSSLPPHTPDLTSLDASDVDAKVLEPSADGRKLDAVSDGEDEPIALLIGKDVKRVMRRKGLSDGKIKVSRRREQHKDLESHQLESHEWSPRVSELQRILDPVSLEDPKDIELKKAIAKLLKEVAVREEKRRNKQHVDSNDDNNESDDNVSHKDLNISADHRKLKASEDYRDDGSIENHYEVDDHADSGIHTFEDSNDMEFHSSSIDVDDDLKLNDDDNFVSKESDYEDRVSHAVKNAPKKQEYLEHDDDHDEKYIKVQHNADNDLKHKNNHHNNNSHGSKETIEEETNVENFNIDNVTLKQPIDGDSEDNPEAIELDGEESQNKNANNYKLQINSNEKRNHNHDKQPKIDIEVSHNDDNTFKTETQEDDQSHQNPDNDIKTQQKENEIRKDLQNENASENILNEENHNERNSDHESDQIQKHQDRHDSKDSRHYSFENYDILNDISDEKPQPKDQGAKKTIDQSSKDHNDFINNRRSYGDSSKSETEKDSQNDLSSNLTKAAVKNDLSSNLTNEAVKDDHQNDSIETLRYHLPQRRYRSRDDKISRNYRRASRKRSPIKQYTLSFFLRK